MDPLDRLLGEVRACSIREAELPLGPRPVLRAARSARLLIVGQAPGTRVHKTGVPWNDASGTRLRDGLALDPEAFCDSARVAIVPMGFCLPWRQPRGGDRPPPPECAPSRHDPLLALLPQIRLTLLVGASAQARYLARGACGA